MILNLFDLPKCKLTRVFALSVTYSAPKMAPEKSMVPLTALKAARCPWSLTQSPGLQRVSRQDSLMNSVADKLLETLKFLRRDSEDSSMAQEAAGIGYHMDCWFGLSGFDKCSSSDWQIAARQVIDPKAIHTVAARIPHTLGLDMGKPQMSMAYPAKARTPAPVMRASPAADRLGDSRVRAAIRTLGALLPSPPG
jgi:hypothetical protein